MAYGNCGLEVLQNICCETPKETILRLCKTLRGSGFKSLSILTPNAIYMFSGGSKEGVDYLQYCERLAAYIKANKLGRTKHLSANCRIYHPDRDTIVYLWAPSRVGLTRWYKKYRSNIKGL